MDDKGRRTLGRRVVVFAAVLCAAVSVVAVAQAAIPDSGGVIHGCYKHPGGELRVVDDPACKSNETALAWGQTGPQGAPGPQGPQGVPGPAGPQGEPGVSAGVHIYKTDVVRADDLGQSPGPMVGLTLPAGTYMVWLKADFFSNNGGEFNSGCAIWRDDPVATPDDVTDQHFGSLNDNVVFSGEDDDKGSVDMMTVATLQHDNEDLLGFCFADGDDDDEFVVAQMFAMPVDAVN
jgi:hypothetical protein